MSKIEIIRATHLDLEVVHELGRRTFLDAFAEQNTDEDIHEYVNEAFSKSQIANELANIESEFYLAMGGDLPNGYLKINNGSAQTELNDLKAVEIQRIYVVQEHQGKKIGQLLFNKALEVAESRKASCLWLGVWDKNINAIRFYERHGFVAFDKHNFMLGKDLQTDVLMKLEM